MNVTCVVLSVKLVNSSVRSIPIDGLVAGNLYRVHVESVSLSGTAVSNSKSFETGPPSDLHQQTFVLVIVVVVVPFFVILAITAIFFHR